MRRSAGKEKDAENGRADGKAQSPFQTLTVGSDQLTDVCRGPNQGRELDDRADVTSSCQSQSYDLIAHFSYQFQGST
jgi:hypothetical protein